MTLLGSFLGSRAGVLSPTKAGYIEIMLKLKLFTVFVSFSCVDDEGPWEEFEELDVEAASRADAIAKAEIELARDYEPGGVIYHVEERLKIPGVVTLY